MAAALCVESCWPTTILANPEKSAGKCRGAGNPVRFKMLDMILHCRAKAVAAARSWRSFVTVACRGPVTKNASLRRFKESVRARKFAPDYYAPGAGQTGVCD
jgi:hypothetical protein